MSEIEKQTETKEKNQTTKQQTTTNNMVPEGKKKNKNKYIWCISTQESVEREIAGQLECQSPWTETL